LGRLLKENRVVSHRRVEIFEACAANANAVAVARLDHRDLMLVRRNAVGVIADARESGECGAEAGADVENAGGRRGETREKKAGRTILGVDDRLAAAIEKTVVKIGDTAFLLREDVDEYVEGGLAVAIERKLQGR